MGTRTPRVIDDARARKLAQDLNGDYIETCATYGMNIDRVFCDAALKVLRQKGHVPKNNAAQLGLGMKYKENLKNIIKYSYLEEVFKVGHLSCV